MDPHDDQQLVPKGELGGTKHNGFATNVEAESKKLDATFADAISTRAVLWSFHLPSVQLQPQQSSPCLNVTSVELIIG